MNTTGKSHSKIRQIEDFLSKKYHIDIESDISSFQYDYKEKLEILEYFWISKLDIQSYVYNFDLTWLDIIGFFQKHREYIEHSLHHLEEEDKIALLKAFMHRIIQLNYEIEELKQQEKKIYINLSRFRENRWIIHQIIMKIWDDYYKKILPSAYFLAMWQENVPEAYKKRYEYIKEIFSTPLTKKWQFFESMFWKKKLLNIESKEDKKVLDAIWYFEHAYLQKESILCENDKKIEEESMIRYMGTISVLATNDISRLNPLWTLPGYAISLGYSVGETASPEDFAIKILKEMRVIPQEYRIDKRSIDRFIALPIGIIPGAFTLSKITKITQFVKNLTPEQKQKFKEIEEKMKKILQKWPKAFISSTKIRQETIDFINTIIANLKPWKSIHIGTTTVMKLESGKYKLINEKKVFTEQPLEEVDKIISWLHENDIIDFALEQKICFFTEKFSWNQATIANHQVSINGGIYEVLSPQWFRIKWEALENFIYNNKKILFESFLNIPFDETLKDFKHEIYETIGTITLSEYIQKEMGKESVMYKKEFSWKTIDGNMKLEEILNTLWDTEWETIIFESFYSPQTEELLLKGSIVSKNDFVEAISFSYENNEERKKEWQHIATLLFYHTLNTLIDEYIIA